MTISRIKVEIYPAQVYGPQAISWSVEHMCDHGDWLLFAAGTCHLSDATFSVVWSIDPPTKGSSAIRARVETSLQRPTITAYVQITTLAPAKVTLQ